jgi:hypothetical protein
MKKHTIALIAFLLWGLSINAQDDIEKIKANWYSKNYSKAIQLTNEYYKKNKKSLKLDLIKVSSMCMSGINQPDPKHCFDYISQAYKIPDNVKVIIEKAKNNCTTLDLESVSEYVRTSSSEPPRVVGKIGKSTLQEELARRGDTTKTVKYFSPEELQKRKLKLKSKKPADFFKKIFDSVGLKNYQIKVLKKFIVVHAALGLNELGLPDIEARLNNYYNFFVRQFGMKEPEEYISVFLAKDINELQYFSEKLHGFIPPSYTLGYSSLEDQAIVAIAFVPDKPLMGTACHELFHILSKYTFETLPAWLEEGMASLYEVSQPNGNTIEGLNNWRIDFLLASAKRRNPKLSNFTVDKIVSLDWNEFNRPDLSIANVEPMQSFNYAYSRYLMLYLQEKGKLADFFKEAANYSYMDIKKGPVSDYVDMIKKYSGDLLDFDETFRRWVEEKPLLAHR